MKPVLAAVVVLLAGCAQTSQQNAPEGTPVTFVQLLEETAQTPVECSAYDTASDSCEALSTYTRSGDQVVNAGTFLISTDPLITARGTVRLMIVDGEACGDLGQTKLQIEGMDDPGAEAFITQSVVSVLGALGEICASYNRIGAGHYVAEYRTVDGRPLPDAREDLRFFAAPKKLRPIE